MARKTAIFLLALTIPALAGDLSSLQTCVTGIESDSTRYHHWLPEPIFTMDRRLFYMDLGITYHRQNLAWLSQHTQAPSVTMPERHLLRNAVEGCERYRGTYEGRAHRFLALLACLIGLVTALTARLVFTIVPGPRKKNPDAPLESRAATDFPSSPPSDR